MIEMTEFTDYAVSRLIDPEFVLLFTIARICSCFYDAGHPWEVVDEF